MSFPLRLPDQLRPHLRALRKNCGLTQAQLGTLIGVKQARIAEIEANPGAVSLDQLTKVLAALGGTLHLHSAEVGVPPKPEAVVPALRADHKTLKASTRKISGLSPAQSGQGMGAVAQRKVAKPGKTVPRARVLIRPKKGLW